MQELRTTTGQRIRIAYDPSRDVLSIQEDDWCADPLKASGAPVKSHAVRTPTGDRILTLLTRRVGRHAA